MKNIDSLNHECLCKALNEAVKVCDMDTATALNAGYRVKCVGRHISIEQAFGTMGCNQVGADGFRLLSIAFGYMADKLEKKRKA